VLAEALALVDERGLEALTMRALAARLEVEAMSLYNHVPGKQGLYDGIRGLLWDELGRALATGESWQQSLRSVARCLRGIAHSHPNAFPLILSRTTLDERMLRTAARGLAMLDEGGFDRDRAAKTLNAVIHYALGYAMMELSLRAAVPPAQAGDGDLETIVRLSRMLPADSPPELVRVARDCCARDLDEQFEFGLDALLAGLDSDCDASGPTRGAGVDRLTARDVLGVVVQERFRQGDQLSDSRVGDPVDHGTLLAAGGNEPAPTETP
jgi:AcrR family transcriptional regulator